MPDPTIAVRFNADYPEQDALYKHATSKRNASGEIRRLAYIGYQIEQMGLDVASVARLMGSVEGFNTPRASRTQETKAEKSSTDTRPPTSYLQSLRDEDEE